MTPDQRAANQAREGGPYKNTDRELWREGNKDDGMSYYEPSIQVTERGGIGINVGGTVYVRTLREWHALASALEDARRENDAIEIMFAEERIARQAAEARLAEVTRERDEWKASSEANREQAELQETAVLAQHLAERQNQQLREALAGLEQTCTAMLGDLCKRGFENDLDRARIKARELLAEGGQT